MRLSVFSPTSSPQLFIDLKKLYHGYLDEQQLTVEALQTLISIPNKLFFTTLFNARHLGAVQVSIQQQKAELTLLCIRDITRRRGVGKNLLREVEKQLQERGINTVQLSLTDIKESEQQGLKHFMLVCGYQLNGQIFLKEL
ncbi:aspartate 1-decarboxylase autocleavage activator PanM [Psychromonas hadalis]|uniref:aspartate 1-decarboxylase autocleavage activator PanM n=1 Tax=Psychromonas hadalis TaxID=211669 RepID=UPI0003B548AB|nr:aspartate 1-decarboxylase autocleavage activator PanM [Psychromonas hadalis]